MHKIDYLREKHYWCLVHVNQANLLFIAKLLAQNKNKKALVLNGDDEDTSWIIE